MASSSDRDIYVRLYAQRLDSGRTSSHLPWVEAIRLCRLRFFLRPTSSARVGWFLGPDIRGGIGHSLKSYMGCRGNRNEDCKGCSMERKTGCVYAAFFVHGNHEPKGMFLRLDPGFLACYKREGGLIAKERSYGLDLILLGKYIPLAAHVLSAMMHGPLRVDKRGLFFELEEAGFLDQQGLFKPSSAINTLPREGYPLIAQSSSPRPEVESSSVKIEFLTPTEITRTHRKYVREPGELDFQLLVRRMIERTANVASACCNYPENRAERNNPSVRSLVESAREVTLRDYHDADWRKVGFRNKPERIAGGLLGPFLFKGVLDPYLSLFEAARCLGIGRGTNSGFGDMTYTLL